MANKKSAALPGKPRASAKSAVPDEVAEAFVSRGTAAAAVPATAKPVGRPKTGKRSNPDYARLTAWVPTEVLEALKIEALKRKCDLGDLIMERMDFTDIETL
ncbi:MAG: hypothetical protein AAFQ95_15760 [Cyanobacteria bacterium J06621_3]